MEVAAPEESVDIVTPQAFYGSPVLGEFRRCVDHGGLRAGVAVQVLDVGNVGSGSPDGGC